MSFNNCAEAYAAGRSNIVRSDPAYSRKLDRDNDGIACDDPPANFTPAPAGETGTGTQVPGGAVDGGNLPVTGPAAELGIFGTVLLMLGIAGTLAFRRRRVRFTS